VDAQTCRSIVPPLTPETLGGIYTRRSGNANPQRTSQAFAWAFQDLGGEIREHTPVLEILAEGGKVKGLRTPQGEIHAAGVVVCAGCPCGPAAGPAGAGVPGGPRAL
jgi:sarcosine oxidase subunit beta